MDNVKEKRCNDNFEPLPGEFVYKNVPYCKWTKLEFIQRVENDDIFYSDDTILATYPKSGTTVVQEMIWLINNDINIEKAKKYKLIYRFPFIEQSLELSYPNMNFNGYIINGLKKLERPRFLKTHLLFRNLETQIMKNPEMKIVICLRNPKDTAVSMFHFYKGNYCYGPYKGSWDEFFERWINGWIAGGDWLDVCTEWWNQRHRINVKILFFEEIIHNKEKVIKELCIFFNKNILNDDDIRKIINHTSFDDMKENPATNYLNFEEFEEGFIFMRKGEVGDWRNYFSEEQNKRVEDKYGSVLKECGLQFQYD